MLDSAGGRTQLSVIITTIVVLLTLLFLTAPLAYLPEAALSSIVFLIGVDLIDLKGMRSIFVQRPREFWIALITTLTVAFVGVEQGILLAILLSLIAHTRHGYRPKNLVLAQDKSGVWHAQPFGSGAQAAPGLLIYRFTHSMYYANAQELSEEIYRLVDSAEPPLRWLCIDVSAVDDVDYSAAQTLCTIDTVLKERGVHLVIAQVLDDVETNTQEELRRLFDRDAFYDTLDDVVKDYTQRGLVDPKQ